MEEVEFSEEILTIYGQHAIDIKKYFIYETINFLKNNKDIKKEYKEYSPQMILTIMIAIIMKEYKGEKGQEYVDKEIDSLCEGAKMIANAIELKN